MPSGIYKHKHCSEDTKRKIREALKGKKLSEKHKKEISILTKLAMKNPKVRNKIRIAKLGKKLTIKTRKRMSEAHKREKAYNYKGYDSSDFQRYRKWVEHRLWREAVFARDNWTCQKCGEKGGKLNAHHILNFADYPESRFAIDNGITLCKKCHTEFHKKYGYNNNTKEQSKEFLKNKQK